MRLEAAGRYIDHEYAVDLFKVDHERRLQIPGNGLDFRTNLIGYFCSHDLPGIGNTEQDASTQGIGKGADLPSKMGNAGSFEFEKLSLSRCNQCL